MFTLLLTVALASPAAPPHGALFPFGAPLVPSPSSPGPPARPATGRPMPPGPTSPVPPAPAPRGSTSPRSPTPGPLASIGRDWTDWSIWWLHNKAPYLALKAHLHAEAITGSDDFFLGHGAQALARDHLKPAPAVIREQVVPALVAALERERSNDILTAALVALAKMADGESAPLIIKALIPFLSDGSQDVAESAAIALGILGAYAPVSSLVELMNDSDRGRGLVRKSEVPYRTRAFAAYGLGLAGAATDDNALRQRIAEDLIDVLESPRFAARDIQVAALTAFGLTPVDVEPSIPPGRRGAERGPNARHVISRRSQIGYLLNYLQPRGRDRDAADWIVRAHVPTALARLLEDASEQLVAPVAAALLGLVRSRSKEQAEILQSCVLALGEIGDADGDGLDAEIRAALIRLVADGDPQTRRFALIGLAHIGSRPGTGETPVAGTRECTRVLLQVMARGKTQLKPWAGLALGVLGRGQRDRGLIPEPGVSTALRQVTADCKRPHEVGAFAIGIALRGDLQAERILLEHLRGFASAQARGQVAVALGLLGLRTAMGPIQAVLAQSKYKPDLLREAAVGLGLLGDKRVVPELVDMLEHAVGLASQASIASALGMIGDARSIDPLLAMLASDRMTDTARAFAAVALGIVCEREPLPWNAKISVGINYRALSSTLVGGANGVLEIL